MKESEVVRLPAADFTREQAQAVTAQYTNVAIENDLGSCFRIVVSQDEKMVWQAWNYEHDAGYWLNRYIDSYGIRKTQ
ncbi:DUF905 family protein [Pantoea stewartii]|uniref:DUF905 family protein n=1 Tax=Pantoea stewartii TaxID=66269 RepID=UPI00345B7158